MSVVDTVVLSPLEQVANRRALRSIQRLRCAGLRRRWSTAPRREESPAGESPQLEESEADPIGKCA